MNRVFRALPLMVAVIAVSCAAPQKKNSKETVNAPVDKMYFLAAENCIYNDENAEFDTLSYVVGMNYGLLAQSTYLDAGYDREAFRDGFFEVLDASKIDYNAMRNTLVYVDEFGSTRYVPYMQTKQRNAFLKTMNPDAMTVTPILYNEEFNEEQVSAAMGRYMAGQLRHMQLPLNRHWIETAINDSYSLENMNMADSVMRISQADFRATMGSHVFSQSIKDRLAEKCDKWLKKISEKDGICEYRPDDDSDAVYYRIDAPGGEVRATKGCDSIYFDYALYNSHGLLLESSEEMVKAYDRYAERITNDESISEEQRAKIMANVDKMRNEALSGGVIVDNLKQKVLAGCVKEIGAGGKMTVWMPASYVPKGSQNNAYTNDGMVMTINLRRVVPQKEVVSVPMPTITKRVPSKSTATKLMVNAQ